MTRVLAYIVLVLKLFVVEGRGGFLTDIPDYEPRKDIKINNNKENEYFLDIDENDLLVNKLSDAESDRIFQQYINDDDSHFDHTTSNVAHGNKDQHENSKLASYIAFLTSLASATFICLASLLERQKNIMNEFGIGDDIDKQKKLMNSDVNKFPVINNRILGISGDILSKDLTNHSQQSVHTPRSSLPNDRLFANVESDYNNSFKKRDMNEGDVSKYIARLKEEASKFYRNAKELKDELLKARREKADNWEIDFLIKQNNYGFSIKDAEIAEVKYLSEKKLNGEFDGGFMTTGRAIYTDILKRKSKLHENLSKSDEPEIMAVNNMKLPKIDNVLKQRLNVLYQSEKEEKEFYPNIRTLKPNVVRLFAHLKVLSPSLPVNNPNEFYIEFDEVSDSFTGELEEQRVYKIEKLYGIGSTAVILGGRPIDKHNQPVGELLALKIVFEKVQSDMGDIEKHLSRITTGEELLLAAGAAKQKQLGLPVNAQSATERTGILFPVKSMSLTSKPGYILTRPDGGFMIHPKVYAYPAMAPSFDDALMSYEPSERKHFIDYFARNLILSAAHMHSMGLVHLDDKGDNVLVGPGGRLYLCDFSFARPIREPFEEEAIMNEIFLDPEGRINRRNYVSEANEVMDSWRIGISILDLADEIPYTGKPFNPSSFSYDSITRLSQTLIDIVWDLTEPFRNSRLTPSEIIRKYPEFFGIRGTIH